MPCGFLFLARYPWLLLISLLTFPVKTTDWKFKLLLCTVQVLELPFTCKNFCLSLSLSEIISQKIFSLLTNLPWSCMTGADLSSRSCRSGRLEFFLFLFLKLDQCNAKGSALPAGQEWDQLYGTMRGKLLMCFSGK